MNVGRRKLLYSASNSVKTVYTMSDSHPPASLTAPYTVGRSHERDSTTIGLASLSLSLRPTTEEMQETRLDDVVMLYEASADGAVHQVGLSSEAATLNPEESMEIRWDPEVREAGTLEKDLQEPTEDEMRPAKTFNFRGHYRGMRAFGVPLCRF